ncbi:MAG: hypothetical protein OIF55_08250 [Amphritea sp.]|nr:hypothetical protein [Amphritea sp.]
MNSPAKILFYVQYLLGIGHVRRAALNVQAMTKAGLEVHVVFGGMPLPHISFAPATVHHLTPVRSADEGFSGLVKADGSALIDQDKAERTAALLQICEDVRPDLIITETYPFGRRQMRFELKPLLKWVKQQSVPPALVASIRDIQQARKPERQQETVDLINDYYDQVLVHGDEAFTPLQASFDLAGQISEKTAYSGYICPPAVPQKAREPLILFSIGGGAVGKEILDTAVALHNTGFANDCQWLLITGPNMAAEDKLTLQQAERPGLKVVELADDFIDSMSRARLSVSMAGYNTVMDILQTQVPAVVVPFEAEGETEQITRALLLEDKGLMTIVREKSLTPDKLQQAMEQAMAQASGRPDIDMDGASHSASLVRKWAENSPAYRQRQDS